MSGSRRSFFSFDQRAAAIAGVLTLAACTTEPADTATTTQTSGAMTSSTGPGPSSTAGTGTDTAELPTTGSETAAGSTTAAACGAGGIDDCCCFEVDGDADHPILGIACMAGDAPCEAPQALCPDAQTQCGAAELQVTSAEGLECILNRLASGEAGLVTWGVAAGNGIAGSSHSLFVQADGTAFVSTYAYDDVSYTYGAVERRALQAASFFTDCAAKPDNERFDCLEQATKGDATETCVAGFMGAIGR